LNDENLITFDKLTPRERTEISRKGAIASNKVQKQKKMMREVVQNLMKMELNADTVSTLKEKLPFLEDGMDMQTAIVLGQMKSAIDGNSKAFELLSTMNDAENGNKANDYEQELSVDELRGLLNGNQSKSTDNPKT
jgi:hypothetical protein